MTDTYKAVEVSAPGTLRVVKRPISELGNGLVRIRVEACGVCHSDAATVIGNYPGLILPRVYFDKSVIAGDLRETDSEFVIVFREGLIMQG